MKKLLIIFIAALQISNLAAQGEILDKIIAVVDREIILQSEVDEQFRLLEAQQGNVPPEARCLITDQLMVKSLLLAQAQKDSVEVGDEEVDQQINSRVDYILATMGGDIERFEQFYEMSVLELKEKFRDDMKAQLLSDRMQALIVENVSVTPSEVRDFFHNVPADSLPYFSAEVELSELVVTPAINEEERTKALEEITDLRRRVIEDEESFSKLAEANSDDPGSAKQGGSLGWVKRGQMVPEFEAALFKLKNKQISPIIKTEFGYHIIQAVERRGNTVFARHILAKPEITYDDTQKAKQKLDSIRTLILGDSITFTRAVKQFSENEESKNNAGMLVNPQTGTTLYTVGDLPTEIYFAVDEMEVGDISEPLEYYDARGEAHYRVIYLRSYTKPHKANLNDDYAKIQKAAVEQKKAVYMSDWIDKTAVKTYMIINDDYRQCPNMGKWFEHTVK